MQRTGIQFTSPMADSYTLSSHLKCQSQETKNCLCRHQHPACFEAEPQVAQADLELCLYLPSAVPQTSATGVAGLWILGCEVGSVSWWEPPLPHPEQMQLGFLMFSYVLSPSSYSAAPTAASLRLLTWASPFLYVQTDGFLFMSSVTLHFTAKSACAVFLFGFIWFFSLMLRKFVLLLACVC